MDQNISAWLSAIDDLLPDITQRLREVVILERDAIELITTEIYDKSDTLIYCDPPYMPGTRVNPSAYGVEADEEYHAKLAVVLLRSKAKVILSGYRCEQYDEWYKGWVRKDKDVVVNVSKEKSGGKGTRVRKFVAKLCARRKGYEFSIRRIQMSDEPREDMLKDDVKEKLDNVDDDFGDAISLPDIPMPEVVEDKTIH